MKRNNIPSIMESDNSTLVVGDVHVAQGQNLERADWLGRAITELNPTRVVFIGDLMTFDCFSNWDKDKRKKMEGRRYIKEIEKGREFISRMYDHAPNWKGDIILTEGNHEDRVSRYLDYNPELDGALDYQKDLGIKDEWTIIPYKEYYNVQGVAFTHIPISEAGKPLGGKYVCHRALELHQGSVVFGHTHKLQVAPLHRHGSPHLNQALNVGCYFSHIDEYALGSVTSYWRGLVLVDHYKHGRFGWMPFSMGKLKQRYRN